jgi:hypothetical protein
LYRGPSRFDNSPIVVVATFSSKNGKTGNMIQTWILRSRVHPSRAVRRGRDRAVCGTCRFRGGRGCYVQVGKAPAAVWRGVKRGIYPVFDAAVHGSLFSGRAIRLGSYGDPAAVPPSAWREVLRLCSGGHTGYTHAWKGIGADYLGLLQASCDNAQEAVAANEAGWRSFTVLPGSLESFAGAESLPGLGVLCVAESRGRSCLDCRLCSGSRANVWIPAHGSAVGKARLSLSMVR